MCAVDQLRAAPGAEIVLCALAGEAGVYVVGGAVRDALLGHVPSQLDLVVEGDAVAVAQRVAAQIGGTITRHERFGTATVRAADFDADFAAARRETYARPGALPDVQLGASIEEDLARRDFSVNAIAVRLADDAIVEWDGARSDLRAGVLRVLHDGSFLDDPTRMLRLVRYAHRLGFEPDPDTAALVDPALLATVSGERLGNELRLLMREGALGALERFGLGEELFGGGFRAAPGLLALADVPDLRARLDQFGFTARERDSILGFQRLRGLSGTDADLWRALRRERPETIELLAAAGEPGARRWLQDIRHRKLEIDGRDLLAAGLSGAAVGAGLERATVAMLEGRAADRESQLREALAAGDGERGGGDRGDGGHEQR
jgi:tRNA nucleotidyltransferase (CCA-adding enzyme)